MSVEELAMADQTIEYLRELVKKEEEVAVEDQPEHLSPE
eukprot:CAMPEP_0185620520 /NCGR_PEP_ID=MMETSP0436-20130131/54278_1 /TAXON_ID=626734 ORGANISM="Favella taraikaensis, Strain Fe Narragansett Bay" /NCGR_SAMPLE_ID=MMETSP0436 /ASSEMBLY_ACC=CAM_ASM_000390 /LENGTH=38 /DNA_ID= /DNA_START= /DNA_END= /DNA_ORIENTATION=